MQVYNETALIPFEVITFVVDLRRGGRSEMDKQYELYSERLRPQQRVAMRRLRLDISCDEKPLPEDLVSTFPNVNSLSIFVHGCPKLFKSHDESHLFSKLSMLRSWRLKSVRVFLNIWAKNGARTVTQTAPVAARVEEMLLPRTSANEPDANDIAVVEADELSDDEPPRRACRSESRMAWKKPDFNPSDTDA